MALLQKLKNLLPGGGADSSATDRKDRASSKSVIFVGGLLVVSILVMIALLSFETVLSRHSKIYNSIVLELQVISQQIAISALEVASGNSKAFVRLAENRNRYINSLRILEEGNNSENIPPLSIEFSAELSNLQATWENYDVNINTLVAAEVPIETVNQYVTLIKESLPQLDKLFTGVIKDLIKAKAPSENIEVVVRQLILIHGLEQSMHQILTGGETVMAAAERFSSDAEQIEVQLIAMFQIVGQLQHSA